MPSYVPKIGLGVSYPTGRGRSYGSTLHRRAPEAGPRKQCAMSETLSACSHATREADNLADYLLFAFRLTKPRGYDLASLSEFCDRARELSRLEFKSKIDPELPRLEETWRQIPHEEITPTDHRVVNRIFQILSSADDDDFVHERLDELDILIWALERENTPRDAFPDFQDTVGMIRLLEESLAGIRTTVASLAHWWEFRLLHEDPLFVRFALSTHAHYLYVLIQSLLLLNVDREISSRLALPPDQWSTRLFRVLRPLDRALSIIRQPTDEDVQKVRSLAQALEPFQEDLAGLRLDSLFPVAEHAVDRTASDNGVSSLSTSDGETIDKSGTDERSIPFNVRHPEIWKFRNENPDIAVSDLKESFFTEHPTYERMSYKDFQACVDNCDVSAGRKERRGQRGRGHTHS